MAGRGPAPQPNAVDPRRGVSIRHEVRPGAPWPVPDGEWHPKAVRWWRRMTSSPTAALWDSPADVDLVERGLVHADAFWRAADDGRNLRDLEATLTRVETVLWLNRTERARQGIKADTEPPPQATVSSSRQRLRAVDDAVG